MIEHLLNRSLAVWRREFTADGSGGREATWQQVGTVKARTSQPSAAEQIVAAQAEGLLSHPVYLAAGADVARGDELRGDGQVFEVHAVFTPSRATAYQRADCQLRQAEQEV